MLELPPLPGVRRLEILGEVPDLSDLKLPKRSQELVDLVETLEGRATDAEERVTAALERLKFGEEQREAAIARDTVKLDSRAATLDQQEAEITQQAATAVSHQRAEIEKQRQETIDWKRKVEEQVSRDEATARALIEDKLRGFEFVGEAWADYERGVAAAQSRALRSKSHPALKAAEVVRAKGEEVALATRRAKAAEWTVALYEYHLPWITDLRDQAEQEAYIGAAEEQGDRLAREDPVSRFLSREEFSALPEGERNQRALDRYLRSRKSPWQLGRDYERYVGYLREQAGFTVTYHGIEKGLEDLGRDVLAERDGSVEVIQCKRWAQAKTIHEKHVFQLYGTMVLARLENPDKEISGTFTTTTGLSSKAREVAGYLDIKVEEQFPLKDYPRIKCNIGRRGEERIYHLPFDQQYDSTLIEPERGERYVSTVAEAEAGAFRRAWRWRGASNS
jgi:hypothetical protein